MLRVEDEKVSWLWDSTRDPDFHDGYTPIRPRTTSAPCMQPRPRSTIVVTEGDQAKLKDLLRERRHGRDAALVRSLEATLSYAFVVPAHRVGPDIVTMNSHVLCHEPRGASPSVAPSPSVVQLVYANPGDHAGRVPVLSPFGIALLGARVGQTTMWSSPDRQVRRVRVAGLPYQPERAGDFHL